MIQLTHPLIHSDRWFEDLLSLNIKQAQALARVSEIDLMLGTIAVNNKSGSFIFSNPGAAFVAVKKAVQRVMTFIGYSWLKDLLFSHDNNTIRLTIPPLLTDEWLQKFPPLNEQQALALAKATEIGPTLSQRITLIEVPPSTGKTGVVSKIILCCVAVDRKWLLVAEIHFAVQVCAERIHQELQSYGNFFECIFVRELWSA